MGDAREAQVEAKAQFEITYDLFKQLTEYKGGELETLYEGFCDEIESCEEQEEEIDGHVEGLESVSVDLFAEWSTELGEIASPALREKSQQRLEETVTRYERLIASLRATRDKMAPVVTAFSDHVLFLKHDLNAHAIAALDQSVNQTEKDISSLFAEMASSIKQANAFMDNISTKPLKPGT